MANKYFTGEYNYDKMKGMRDWGKGNTYTGNLPLKGEHVQRLIEDSVNEKVGAIKQIGDLVCAFASEKDYETYLEYLENGETEKAEALIKDSWQGIRPNTIILNMIEPEGNSKSYLFGDENMKISFYWDTQNQNYQHALDERGVATVSAVRGNTPCGEISKVIEQDIDLQGNEDKLVSIDLTNMLKQPGTYEVTLTVTGNKSLVTVNKIMTYTVIQLGIADAFDISTPRFVEQNETMPVSYYLTAQTSEAYVDFIVDGDVDHKYTQRLQNPDGGLTTYTGIEVKNLSEGVHSLQIVGRILIGVDWYYTDILYREFAVVRSTAAIPYTMLANEIPVEMGADIPFVRPEANGENILTFYNAMQYIGISFNFAVYQHNIDKTLVKIYLNDEEVGSMNVVNNVVNMYTVYPDIYGPSVIRLDTYNSKGELTTSRNINVNIESAQLNISNPENNMRLNLKARGRSDNDTNREEWNYTNSLGNTIQGQLHNFTWTKTCGWDEENNTLVVGNGASVDINYAPFAGLVPGGTSTFNGLTFILEFATENVSDDNTIICDLRNSNGFGLVVRASRVEYFMNSPINPDVTTTFQSGEVYRIALVIEGKRANDDKQLLALYVNGIISNARAFTIDTLTNIATKIKFLGSDTAEIRIKEIKICDAYFSSDQILNDYILSRDILYNEYKETTDDTNSTKLLLRQGMMSLYNANNIYDKTQSTWGDLASVLYNLSDDGTLVQNIPIIFMTARKDIVKTEYQSYLSLHDLEGEVQSKEPYIWVDIYFRNYKHPEMNFYARKVRVKIQGTSSLSYQKKNFKIYTNRSKYGTDVWVGEDCLLMIGEPKSKGKISFKRAWKPGDDPSDPGISVKGRKDAQPVNKFVLKADCSDSSSAHNTGMARLWNELFQNFQIPGVGYAGRTKAQQWAAEVDYKYDVRTCVDGYPTLLFYRESEESEWEFIGKYNFNNDKGDEDVYGFGKGSTTNDITDPFENLEIFDPRRQMWEGLSSSNEVALGTADMRHDFFLSGQGKTNDEVIYGWSQAFECRYPEQPDNTYSGTNKNLLQAFVEQGNVNELYDFYCWLSDTRYDDKAVFNPEQAWTSIYDTAQTITINGHKFTEKEINGKLYTNGTYPNTPEYRKAKFTIEKWDRFEIYKVAAYYCYLMRYGAVDQTVKNAIWATEGNEWDKNGSTKYPCQWFFINYDNDTILGSRNDGELAYGPYIARKSASAEEDGQQYAYAGENSVIWNQLEDDKEFMGIVQIVDNALVKAGMTYENSIYYFNTLQSEKWPERIYNRDQIYKYISPNFPAPNSTHEATNHDYHLLQGSRMAHRKWWINKRFALYDSMYASGDYNDYTIAFKMDETQGLQFETNKYTEELLLPTVNIDVTPGGNVYYGWSIKNDGTNTHLGYKATFDKDGNGLPMTFTIKNAEISVGNFIFIYAAESIAKLDMSQTIRWLSEPPIMSNIKHPSRGTQLKELYVGNTAKALALKNSDNPIDNEQYKMYISKMPSNNSLDISACEILEVLDIYGLTYVPQIAGLDSLKFLREFKAWESGLSIVRFADGAPLQVLQLPTYKDAQHLGVTQLYLKNLSDLESKNITFDREKNSIATLEITNCAKLDNDYQFVFDWYANKTVKDEDTTLVLNNMAWDFKGDMTYALLDKFIKLLEIGNITLKGELKLYYIDSPRYFKLLRYFESKGMEVFDYNVESVFKIRLVTAQLFLDVNDIVYEGNTIAIEPSVLSNEKIYIKDMSYSIDGYFSNPNASVELAHPWGSDEIISPEDAEVDNKGYFTPYETGLTRYVRIMCRADARTEETLNNIDPNYKYASIIIHVAPRVYPSTVNITAGATALTDTTKEYYFSYNVDPEVNGVSRGAYVAKWSLYNTGNTEDSFTDFVEIKEGDTARTCVVVLSSNETVLKGGIRVDITFVPSNDKYVPALMQGGNTVHNNVELIVKDPESILSEVENPEVFHLFKSLNDVDENGNMIWNVTQETSMTKAQAKQITSDDLKNLFKGHTEITEFTQLPYFTSVTEIPEGCFSGCTNLTAITFSNSMESIFSKISAIRASAFEGTGLKEIIIPQSVGLIEDKAFRNCKNLKSLIFESAEGAPNIYGIGNYAFEGCSSLQFLTIPYNAQDSYMGEFIYKDCTGATGYTYDSNFMTNIKKGVFYNCTSLQEINISEKITTVEASAFTYCRAIRELNIPDSVETIKAGAFAYCGADSVHGRERMDKVTLGSGITECEDNAFAYILSKEVYLNQGYHYDGFLSLFDINNNHIYLYKDNVLAPNKLSNHLRAQYTVIDANYDAEIIDMNEIDKGYFSINETLFKKSENEVLIVKFVYHDDKDFNLLSLAELHTFDFCFGYIGCDTMVVPENIIIGGNNVFINSSIKNLILHTSISKGGQIFYNSNISHLVLSETETYIPESGLVGITHLIIPKGCKLDAKLFGDTGSGIIVDCLSDVESLEINNMTFHKNGNSLYGDLQIRVPYEFFDSYYMLFTTTHPFYGNILRYLKLPEYGSINVISGSTWSNDCEIVIGGNVAKQLYNGSYVYESQSGNTDTTLKIYSNEELIYEDVYKPSNSKLIFNETNINGIDFSVNRGIDAYKVGTVTPMYQVVTNNTWNYIPEVSGVCTNYGVGGSEVDLILKLILSEQFRNQVVTVTFGMNLNVGAESGQYSAITRDYLNISSSVVDNSYTFASNNPDYNSLDASNKNVYNIVKTSAFTQDIKIGNDGIITFNVHKRAATALVKTKSGAIGAWVKSIVLKDQELTYDYPAMPIVFGDENDFVTNAENAISVILPGANEATKVSLAPYEGTYAEASLDFVSLNDALDFAQTNGFELEKDGKYYLSTTVDDEMVFAYNPKVVPDDDNKIKLTDPDTIGYVLESEILEYNNR